MTKPYKNMYEIAMKYAEQQRKEESVIFERHLQHTNYLLAQQLGLGFFSNKKNAKNCEGQIVKIEYQQRRLSHG